MIVGRRAAVRKPTYGNDSQSMVRLLVQWVKTEAASSVRAVHALLQPIVLRQRGMMRERPHGAEDFTLIRQLPAYLFQVCDKVDDRIAINSRAARVLQVIATRSIYRKGHASSTDRAIAIADFAR
jgi:hypothetical protein